MAELICVDPAKVHEVWPHVEGFMQSAVDQCGDLTLVHIIRTLDDGGLLWLTWSGEKINAAAVTVLLQTPGGLVCKALACGGQDDDWQSRFLPIEEYARDEGCVATRFEGRLGWARVFKTYKIAWVCLEKRLD